MENKIKQNKKYSKTIVHKRKIKYHENKNQILSFVTILSVALMTFSCTNDSPKEVTPLKSIVDIAKADPANFSILVDALKTGLDATLGNAGSYTVFAPTNAAFTTAGITSASISAMTVSADIANLKLVLQNHVISLGTRSNDLLAASYTRTFAFLKQLLLLLQELI